jgi:glycosyltransferase involved in cell wall biosynthesis
VNAYACITTLNEEATIEGLVLALLRQDLSVIVVDAGSTDRTVDLARDCGVFVVRAPSRTPIGPALRSAWVEALAQGADAVVQIDAGGSHDPEDVQRLLKELRFCDIVIGSRFAPGGVYVGGSTWRRVGSTWLAYLCNAVTGWEVTSDWTSGFRAFRTEPLQYLAYQEYFARMHPWQMEVLFKAVRAAYRIGTVPIRYTAGRSSFRFGLFWETLRTFSREAL